MNTARLNFTRLNTSVLNASLLNSSLMGGRSKGSSSRPYGLIAQYKPYLNSNDSPTRETLKDYSGHGNDMVLHNFAFAGMSGYGGYHLNFRNWSSDNSSTFDRELTSNKVVFTNIDNYTGSQLNLYRSQTLDAINGIKFKVSGMDDGEIFGVLYKEPGSQSGSRYIKITSIKSDGEVTANIPVSSIILLNINNIKNKSNRRITIEQLPLYPGALVSDGVDDYGICETFPILTKEKGYTVCALRKWLNKEKDQVFLCKTNNPNHGAFMFECYERNEYKIYSYGQLTRVNEFPDLFSHQKTNQYNTTSISVGNYTDGSTLFLFRGRMDFPHYCEIALYALEIYDRDLSEEEIETVKQRMIAEYEKATGNILEPEENVWLWGDGDTVLWGDETNVLTE